MKTGKVLMIVSVLFPLMAERQCCHAGDIWPGFRGTGDSHAPSEQLPLSWPSRSRGAGSWSIRLPGYGQSSPVVWNDLVFVTAVSGLEKEHLHVLAVKFEDGEILWRQDFSATQKIEDRDTVSRGAPTPAVDGERLYAVFESGDIVALTHGGEVVWKRSFVGDYGELTGPHGYASSPVLAGNLLIVQVAHSGPSYILAVDTETGETRWKTDHPSQSGWSSPVLYERDGQQYVIVSTLGSVRALNVRNGQEQWRVSDVQGNSTASPTVAGDMVIIGAGAGRDRRGGRAHGGNAREGRPSGAESDTSKEGAADQAREPAADSSKRGCLAIRLGGSGNVSTTHIAWRAPQVTVGYASPVVAGDCVFFVNRVGGVQCVDLETGRLHWQHRLPGQVWATPVASQGHVVFFTRNGTVVTLKSGSELVEVGESTVTATDVVYGVAAASGSWIVRTGRGLFRVGSPSREPNSTPQ